MFVIAGLGNPTLKYNNTRHNAGFDAIKFLSEYYNIKMNKSAFHGTIGDGFINEEKIILVKPETYMNNSGECVAPLIKYYDLTPKDNLCVISDDVTLKAGKVRIRKKGSSGGHNGLKSIINLLGTDEFIRLRMGVGIFENGNDMAEFVLSRMPKEDRTHFENMLNDLPEIINFFLNKDVDGAMNKFNGITE